MLVHGAAMAHDGVQRKRRHDEQRAGYCRSGGGGAGSVAGGAHCGQLSGRQQEQALGLLAGATPMAGVIAFLLAAYLATALSWRYSFGSTVGSVDCRICSEFSTRTRCSASPASRSTSLARCWRPLAIILISFAFNNLNKWGVLFARPGAPFSLFGLSPAPFMIALGLVLGQAFFVWSHKRQAAEQGRRCSRWR